MARTTPVLLVLDDVHWADRPTLQLMTHLAGLDLGRLLLVAAHRDGERPDGPLVETLGALHRTAALTRISLPGLTSQHAAEVMAVIAGGRPDDAAVHLADTVREETNGNPFYLTEMFCRLSN